MLPGRVSRARFSSNRTRAFDNRSDFDSELERIGGELFGAYVAAAVGLHVVHPFVRRANYAVHCGPVLGRE